MPVQEGTVCRTLAAISIIFQTKSGTKEQLQLQNNPERESSIAHSALHLGQSSNGPAAAGRPVQASPSTRQPRPRFHNTMCPCHMSSHVFALHLLEKLNLIFAGAWRPNWPPLTSSPCLFGGIDALIGHRCSIAQCLQVFDSCFLPMPCTCMPGSCSRLCRLASSISSTRTSPKL